MGYKLILILLLNIFAIIKGQSTSLITCTSKQTCTECIKLPECSFCSQPDFYGADKQPLSRCNTTIGHEALERFKCQSLFYFNPQNEVQIIKDKEMLSNKPDRSSTIPLRPQEMSLKLRKGVPAEFKISYSDPEDYPLNLYYLMDLTKTMEDDKKVLADLGDKLAERIKDITTKFRQGFGSFIDKVAMPYVLMTPKSLENPCGKEVCVKPYGFQNHLKLSSSTGAFSEVVKNAKLSGSVDRPEGGLDALMQTIVCNDQIGWELLARRLVIFATDAPFHISGDGKLGGILRPNDGLCHLDENGAYTHSTKMDYPSIAQLNHKAIQNSIHIIFAVTSDQIDIYTKLASRIEGAQSAEISANSSNIVDLVEQEYRRLTSKVQISDNLPKQYVQVKYFSKCYKSETEEEIETDTCDEMPIGSTVSFTAKIELIECPPNKEEWSQKYRIYRVGLPYGISVQLDMLCDCPCENPENWILKSRKCSGFGTEKCGICECDENHFGRSCECSAKDGVPVDETKACIATNSTEICSGRGDCSCGQCNCNKRESPSEVYSGSFCECDNFSCNRNQYGEVCGGEGQCVCGECLCYPGWTGDACECSSDINTCRDPGNSEICSGNGDCHCGKCQCKGRYSGAYCEKCKHESCPNKCEELKPCIQCKVHGTGLHENPGDCELECYTNPIKIVEVISYDYDSDDIVCKGEDETDQCTFYFSYGQHSNNKSLYIEAQRTKECPTTAPIFWIFTGVVGIVVLIGLILLAIWRACIYFKDEKEYAKFNDESKNTTFGTTTNPLYNNPLGHYENPIYGKRIQ